MLHRKLFDEVGLFDVQLPACEDYDLWLRITSKYPVLLLKEHLTLKYGGHQDQLSQQYWGMDRFRIQALHKLLSKSDLTKTQCEAAVDILKKKINIYLIGAKKRNKKDEIDYYKKLLDYHLLKC